jgi:hypothetical protein
LRVDSKPEETGSIKREKDLGRRRGQNHNFELRNGRPDGFLKLADAELGTVCESGNTSTRKPFRCSLLGRDGNFSIKNKQVNVFTELAIHQHVFTPFVRHRNQNSGFPQQRLLQVVAYRN